MAAEEINQVGGINGRRLDVVIDDDGGSPEKAATLAARLIDQDKVIAIIAGGTSGNSRAAAAEGPIGKDSFDFSRQELIRQSHKLVNTFFARVLLTRFRER
jgi:hypothetical protein